MLEKILESPLDSKEVKPVNPKGNQLWIFIGRTDAEAPKLWPPNVKSWLIGKDPGAGKDWGQAEDGLESEGQGSLECCSPWYHRVGHNLVTKQQQKNRLILEHII